MTTSAAATAGPTAAAARNYAVEPGTAAPLGASPGSAANPGVNFALYAPNATSVTLCLRDWQDAPVMETLMHRSGDVWHAFVAGLPQVGG